MVKYGIVILILSKSILLLAQNTTDTIGFYHNGKIVDDWKMIKNQKIFADKTLFLQVKFPSGNIQKEFLRYNDTSFLYTEYYDQQDSFRHYIYREGLVAISNIHLSDTISTLDPVTYEVKTFFDTLLLPINTWKYFHLDGRIMTIGNYENYQKNGKWEYFDKLGNREKIITFKTNGQQLIDFDNVIYQNNEAEIKHLLHGIWIEYDKEANGQSLQESKYDGYIFLYKLTEKQGIGDIYEFRADNSLEYLKTKVTKTEYKNESGILKINRLYSVVENKLGSYKNNLNTLKINLGNEVYNFEMEYLSTHHMRLKIKK